ncbi:MAG: DUF1376 domain-containing protein [Candidatus Acidiferrales bacterium]
MSYRPPFYKRFPQDYLSSSTTRRMTLAEHGVYNLLLDYAWLEEQTATLPADFTVLSKLTGIRKQTLIKFVAKYPQLCCKFASDSQRLYNPRLMAEFEQFLETSEKKRLAGRASGRARQAKSTGVEQVFCTKKLDTDIRVREEKKGNAPALPSLSFSGLHFSVTEKQDALLGEAFPWIDRPAEYRKADSWLEANPERCPKKSNRFLHNWFSRISQPKGKGNGSTKKLTGDDLTTANLKAAGFVQ